LPREILVALGALEIRINHLCKGAASTIVEIDWEFSARGPRRRLRGAGIPAHVAGPALRVDIVIVEAARLARLPALPASCEWQFASFSSTAVDYDRTKDDGPLPSSRARAA
jgi:hypothetical protein